MEEEETNKRVRFEAKGEGETRVILVLRLSVC